MSAATKARRAKTASNSKSPVMIWANSTAPSPMGEAHGFVKVLTVPGKDKILGATIVGEDAGELIGEYVTAMRHGLGLNKILGTIHAYPTRTEANKYAAGEWKHAHAPERILAWLERFHAWRRGQRRNGDTQRAADR